jgi:hypothetical protein
VPPLELLTRPFWKISTADESTEVGGTGSGGLRKVVKTENPDDP